jgi:glycosyltransferase involved in cell wall biosynthesis
MNTKIVLTMIVKNEGHVILRALNSCYKMVDAYCIVDTGSTDDTKEKIKTFFQEKNIPGKIIDFEFTNFEESRNQSIIHATDLGGYGFWMDADEQLILNSDFNKSKLNKFLETENPSQLLINCDYGNMSYQRSQFYKFDDNFYWYGPVHEILKTDGSRNVVNTFDFGKMFIKSDGNSWKSDLSEKYENHAEILLKYQDDNDWKDPRWTFYLAQSYKDAGQIRLSKNVKDEKGLILIRKAIHYFTERTKQTNGFYQEIYYSQLMLARLYYHISSNESVLMHLLKCEELNIDRRIEHLFNIGSFFQTSNMHKNALMYIEKALQYLKQGRTSDLFIESEIYNFNIYDMYGISLYFTGQFEKSLEYFKYALKQAKNGNTRDIEIERIENNVKSVENYIQQQRNGINTNR